VSAQLLMARRYIENWVLWIAVDLVAIGVYAAKDLMVTALLYSVFLVISAVGLMSWRKAQGGSARAWPRRWVASMLPSSAAPGRKPKASASP
jgi:nicotinamide riboside transporter PnuC